MERLQWLGVATSVAAPRSNYVEAPASQTVSATSLEHSLIAHSDETNRATSHSLMDPSPRKACLRYCVIALLLPVLAIPLFIGLGRSDFFLSHGASVWVRSNDAVFSMRDRDCDVLVFGDSTAMTGIDPEVVERNTGLKTCNISVTNAVLAVTNNLTLNNYLSHNGKPRVLLVQLSPDGFQKENRAWRRTIYAEGLLELLRHGNPNEARRVLLTHPQESIAFAGYAAGFTAFYGIKSLWFDATHHRPAEDNIEVRNGFFTPPAPARTFCDPAGTVADLAADGFPRTLVEEYRNHYGPQTGVVLVNVAPIPACDQNLAAYQMQLDGVTSNSLLPLPIGLFNDERHYTAVGSAIVSRLVAEEVNRVASDPTTVAAAGAANRHVIASVHNMQVSTRNADPISQPASWQR